MPVEIKLEGSFDKLLGELIRRAQDPTPVLAQIGEILLSSVEENFQVGGRFSEPGSPIGGSNKWDPVSPAYAKRKRKKGKDPANLLKWTGRLLASIHTETGEDYVAVGTNAVYAAIHQFGGILTRTSKPGKVRLRTGKDGSLLHQDGYANLAIFAQKKHKRFKEVSFAGGTSYQVNMPARPFLVAQEVNLEEIDKVVADNLIPK
jgi:phage virion morphogenesis protein